MPIDAACYSMDVICDGAHPGRLAVRAQFTGQSRTEAMRAFRSAGWTIDACGRTFCPNDGRITPAAANPQEDETDAR